MAKNKNIIQPRGKPIFPSGFTTPNTLNSNTLKELIYFYAIYKNHL